MKSYSILKEDIPQLIRIHLSSFPKDHFTSCFSKDLLVNYFNKLVELNEYTISLKDQSGRIVGFIIGGKNPDTSIRAFLDENLYKILFVLFRQPKFFYEKIKETFHSLIGNKFVSKEKIRIYLIEVDKDYRNEGLGHELLKNFENILIENKIQSYGLSVRKKNKPAIDFYLKNNFLVEYSDNRSFYFIKSITYNKTT